jgi:hypothetical protein
MPFRHARARLPDCISIIGQIRPQRSSASMSFSWLFLGGLVSTRARFRFTNRGQHAVNSLCRSSIFQRTANYLLTVGLTPGGKARCSSRGAAEINASCQHLHHDEYLRRSLHGSEAQGEYIRRAARALANSTPPNATRIAKGHHSRWPLSLSLCLLDYFGLELKIPIPRNLMIALVAGGGFEPPTFGL